MPTIPMYQQQKSPSGFVQVEPSRAGSAMGGAVENVGQAIGQASRVVAQGVGENRAMNEATQIRVNNEIEAKKQADKEFAAKSWASRAFADAQLETVKAVNEAQRGRQAGQVDSTQIIRKAGQEWTKSVLESAPSEEARRYAKQNLENAWFAAERTAVENDDQYRTQYGVRQFDEAVDVQQKAIQNAPPNMVDTAFQGAAINIRDSLAGLSLDPETKAKLQRNMLSESAIRAGTRVIQAEGPEKFLDIIAGVKRENAGKKKVTRPGNGRWAVEIQQASGAAGVDSSLVEAVMSAESGGNIGAPSSKGALGLMQLMPDTAQELGVDPTKPEQNILGGAKYLAKLSKRYGGDEAKIAAAYNAGMGNVDKAIASAGKDGDWQAEMKKFQSPANFKQTQDYVKKVAAEKARFSGAAGEQKISAQNIPGWWEHATADDRDKLVGVALRMRQELAAANLQYLGDWKKNADAAQSNGLPVPAAPSWQTVVTAHAGDETKATRYWEQNVKPIQDVADLSRRMGGMTIAQMDQQLTDLRPKAGRAEDPNLAADFGRFNAAEQARRTILEQRSRDPMAQALEQPAVKSLAKDPDKMLSAAMAWQQQNVPEGKRSILTDDDRATLEKAWNNPKMGSGINEIIGLQTKYGSYFGEALGEISKKAPSDAVLFAGMNVAPETLAARNRLRSLATKTFDEVIVGHEKDKKLVESAMGKQFAPFFNSFKQTNNIEGTKYVENITAGLMKYTASYLNAGLRPDQAAKRAFEEVVSSQYAFLDGGKAPGGRANVRIPRAYGQDNGLRSQLEDGLDQAIERAPKELAFPAGVSRADGLDEAYWATSANDAGAVMMYKGAPVRVKIGGKLVPFELSWNALANAGKRYQQAR